MTRYLGWLWAGAILLASAAHGVTVDGWAFLWGQSDHAGTRILFSARSPSAVTDSAFTNGDGYFTRAISPGVYDVRYSHADFADYPLPNQALLFDTTLEPVELLPPLSGSLSGMLGPGSFQVTDTIFVHRDSLLRIVPGTRLYFDGPHPFIVNGILQAWGMEIDSIVFTRRYPNEASRWSGIRFVDNPTGDACRMEYCVVEWAIRFGGSYNNPVWGGGIYINGCSPSIHHSAVRRNSVGEHSWYSGGGGIACLEGHPRFAHCEISMNTSNIAKGSGIYCGFNCSAIFEHCVIRRNTAVYSPRTAVYIAAAARPQFLECQFVENDGNDECVYMVDDSGAYFCDCTIRGNPGGGIGVSGVSNALFEGCLISDNGEHGGLRCYQASPRLLRCTFVCNRTGNYSGTIYLEASAAEISSCIIAEATSGAGIFFENSPQAVVKYCDVYGNPGGQIKFLNNNPIFGPPAIGIVALTNANGDSCDTYYNIFLDPMFVDTAAGDYHLTEGSPCIDAGDPALALDPDGTVADMGALYFHQLAVGDERTSVRRYGLAQNYPNPFNAETRIAFEIAHAGDARLDVFDVTGRLIQTLARGPISAGTHEVLFDAHDLPSGTYFARLTAGEFVETRKMLLVK